MMYYQAVCHVHGFASSLYRRRIDAVRSARAHVRNVAGPHRMEILDVWIDNLQIRNTESI